MVAITFAELGSFPLNGGLPLRGQAEKVLSTGLLEADRKSSTKAQVCVVVGLIDLCRTFAEPSHSGLSGYATERRCPANRQTRLGVLAHFPEQGSASSLLDKA